MRYSNQPIQNSAAPVAIEFQASPVETSETLSASNLITNWNSRKPSSTAWLPNTLNRPTAKSNRALREFAKRALA